MQLRLDQNSQASCFIFLNTETVGIIGVFYNTGYVILFKVWIVNDCCLQAGEYSESNQRLYFYTIGRELMQSLWLDKQLKYFEDLTQKNYRPSSRIPGIHLWNKACPASIGIRGPVQHMKITQQHMFLEPPQPKGVPNYQQTRLSTTQLKVSQIYG